MRKILVIMLFLLPLFTVGQTVPKLIYTIAGDGAPGFSGDGGPATLAQFDYTWGVAADAFGNLYIADPNNSRVRKVNSSGIISTFAGNGILGYAGDGGAATAAELNAPVAIALDGAGNVYITDFHGEYIRKVNSSGIISTIAGNGTIGFSGDGGLATLAQLYGPCSIAVDSLGNLYFTDMYNNCLRKIDTSGIISLFAGTGSSTGGYSGDGGPATIAQMYYPQQVALDRSGNVYFSDLMNHRVRKINTSGIISTIAGNGISGFSGDGGPATAAELYGPEGLAIDTGGNIFIGESRIRKINAAGIINTIAGNGIADYSGDGGCATAAGINHPISLAIDNWGNLYSSDELNYRVRKIIDDRAFAFTGGHSQLVDVCVTATDTIFINSLLAVMDTDAGKTDTWSIVSAPSHGILTASYTTTTTGGVDTPSGLTYVHTAGFVGHDTFKVAVTDCGGLSDTTIVCVNVDTSPVAESISGPDSVCKSVNPILLTDTSVAGTWNRSNNNASVSGGLVTGLSVGIDTIFYIVSNACGVDSAQSIVNVISCPTEVKILPNLNSGQIVISPNPVHDNLSINATDKIKSIVISNLIGQTFYSQECNTENALIDVSGLLNGIYLIRINNSEVRKFVKE